MFFIISFFLFLFVVTFGVGNNKPKEYKRGVVKTIFAWLLIILAITLFIKDFMNALNTGLFEIMFRNIYFPSLFLLWGIFILNCGPLYSPIWKRIVKTILYILFSFLFAFICFLPFDVLFENPMMLIIPMVLFIIIDIILMKIGSPTKEQGNKE